jgi:16S rRNA C1402 (ribose-2'-O) methylase RsmI
VAVARELTKHFEQMHRGTLQSVLAELSERFPESVKGECVVILEGTDRHVPSASEVVEIDEEDEVL